MEDSGVQGGEIGEFHLLSSFSLHTVSFKEIPEKRELFKFFLRKDVRSSSGVPVYVHYHSSISYYDSVHTPEGNKSSLFHFLPPTSIVKMSPACFPRLGCFLFSVFRVLPSFLLILPFFLQTQRLPHCTAPESNLPNCVLTDKQDETRQQAGTPSSSLGLKAILSCTVAQE